MGNIINKEGLEHLAEVLDKKYVKKGDEGSGGGVSRPLFISDFYHLDSNGQLAIGSEDNAVVERNITNGFAYPQALYKGSGTENDYVYLTGYAKGQMACPFTYAEYDFFEAGGLNELFGVENIEQYNALIDSYNSKFGVNIPHASSTAKVLHASYYLDFLPSRERNIEYLGDMITIDMLMSLMMAEQEGISELPDEYKEFFDTYITAIGRYTLENVEDGYNLEMYEHDKETIKAIYGE